jgi:GTP-binding protein
VLLTKADKLNRSEAPRPAVDRPTAGRRRRGLLFSALKKQGLDDGGALLWDWTH